MELYKLLYPMRIVLITTRSGKKDNVMAAAWCFPLSFDPPLFGVSISPKRHTFSLLQGAKSFGINLTAPGMDDAVLVCGRNSGKDMDKFTKSGLIKEEAKKINCPLIKESHISIECELIDTIKTGDHSVFVGKAVNVIKRKEAKGLYQSASGEWITV
jgi:flavin reductase (DIM6/NTAB) family NADH-FMN oxidoreductase RutF